MTAVPVPPPPRPGPRPPEPPQKHVTIFCLGDRYPSVANHPMSVEDADHLEARLAGPDEVLVLEWRDGTILIPARAVAYVHIGSRPTDWQTTP